MEPESRKETSYLDPHLSNFVSWYRRLSQENMGAASRLFGELKEVLPGFDSFSFNDVGENTKAFRVVFEQSRPSTKSTSFGFGELSDGQRVLIALYTLIHGIKQDGMTLFLELRQPAPLYLEEACEEWKRV